MDDNQKRRYEELIKLGLPPSIAEKVSAIPDELIDVDVPREILDKVCARVGQIIQSLAADKPVPRAGVAELSTTLGYLRAYYPDGLSMEELVEAWGNTLDRPRIVIAELLAQGLIELKDGRYFAK